MWRLFQTDDGKGKCIDASWASITMNTNAPQLATSEVLLAREGNSNTMNNTEATRLIAALDAAIKSLTCACSHIIRYRTSSKIMF